MLLLLCLFVEGLSVIIFGLGTGRMLSFAEVEADRERVRSEQPPELIEQPDHGPIPGWQVVHPYLGFVRRPAGFAGGVNGYGFLGDAPPFRVGRRDRGASSPQRPAVVAVVGGSVAAIMALDLGSKIARELEGRSCFKDREVQVVNLALPGVKQPQQLLTLEYFLSVGAVIDVLISLDGFNEVALPIAENQAQGVYPFYPRNWKFQIAGLKDIALMRQIGEVEFWRNTRKQLATAFSAAPLRYSATGNTLWLYTDRMLDSHISLKMVDLSLSEGGEGQKAKGYMARGPRRRYESDEENYDDVVAVWSRSTQLMYEASRAAGIAPFHFLQPNQRVAGSKPFAPGEREIALPRRQAYDKPARVGYPKLIAEAKRMRAEGIPINDLTMVFADVQESLYTDGCCHVNDRGSELMILEITRIIHERFEQGEPCPRFE